MLGYQTTQKETMLLEEIEHIHPAQTIQVASWHKEDPIAEGEGLLNLVSRQNLMNFLLWHEEDIARAPNEPDQVIAQVKHNIDGYNQRRNDLIEKIDEELITILADEGAKLPNQGPLNSETPGSMIDRMSILALKVYHMQEQVERTDVDESHRQKSAEKTRVLQLQRDDLFNCLKTLLGEVKAGSRQFKIYRQFKMYNDPELNPKIYGA